MTTSDIAEIGVDQLAAALDEGAPLLDVRMPDEYEGGHVPGALLVPLPELQQRLADVPVGDPLYVICRSGMRSMNACKVLAEGGRSVVNVAGGTLAWIEAGRPVATGPEPG